MDLKRYSWYLTSIMAIQICIAVNTDQWYFSVVISDVNQNIVKQIQHAISVYPEILHYLNGSSLAIVIDKQDWASTETILKSFNVSYSLILDVRQCLRCDDEMHLDARLGPQDQFVSDVILPKYPNQKVLYQEALYTLVGAKDCIVTPKFIDIPNSPLIGTDCLTKSSTVDDGWHLQALKRSDVVCNDAITEGASCSEYTATIHPLKYPGYSLVVENSTFYLSNQTSQNLTISHVNGKDFVEIVLGKSGQPAKTTFNPTNIYIGELIGASLLIEVVEVRGKIARSPSFPFPRVKIHNNSPAKAEVPIKVTDRSKLTGKEKLKSMLYSEFMKDMFVNPRNIIFSLSQINRFRYTVDANQTCTIGYIVATRSAPLLDITLSLTFSHLRADPSSNSYTNYSRIYPTFLEFMYPKATIKKFSPSTLEFQPLVEFQFWTPASSCRDVQKDQIPECKDANADTLESEQCTYEVDEPEESNPEGRMLFKRHSQDDESIEENYSYEIPVTQE